MFTDMYYSLGQRLVTFNTRRAVWFSFLQPQSSTSPFMKIHFIYVHKI